MRSSNATIPVRGGAPASPRAIGTLSIGNRDDVNGTTSLWGRL